MWTFPNKGEIFLIDKISKAILFWRLRKIRGDRQFSWRYVYTRLARECIRISFQIDADLEKISKILKRKIQMIDYKTVKGITSGIPPCSFIANHVNQWYLSCSIRFVKQVFNNYLFSTLRIFHYFLVDPHSRQGFFRQMIYNNINSVWLSFYYSYPLLLNHASILF